MKAEINAAVIGVGTTFGLFGKLALFSAALPYSWGDISGQVAEEAASISRSAWPTPA